MNKKDIRLAIILAIIVLTLFGIYTIIKKSGNSRGEPTNYLKNYGVNEYIPTYVSDANMAKIYLND